MNKKAQKKPEVLATKRADEFVFKSYLQGPISDLSMLERSLLFAEVALIAYLSPEECNIAAGKLGFTKGSFFNSDGSQAYWFHNEWDSVVVCRGTEPNEWNDIQADANALTAIAETVGKVHRGFKSEVDSLWPYLEDSLNDNSLPLWFCGHSLGGAMAKICTSRCTLSHIRMEPIELYTYGAPRVGNRIYIDHVKVPHFRWVNNNDIVTRVPPMWLGYRHSGEELYIDRFGKLNEIRGWKRVSDRLQGFLSELTKFRIDQLSDHSILEYIRLIHRISKSNRSGKG